MGKLLAGLVIAIGFIGLLFVLGLLFAYPVMWLVNYLFTPAVLTAVFGVAKISVWQAWALNLLSGFLFKSTSSK